MTPDATVDIRTLPARERVLATALALFYRDGIRATGIDRVIAEAGVTKVTFYRHFPSKDALVVAFLESRHERWMAYTRSGGWAYPAFSHSADLIHWSQAEPARQITPRACAKRIAALGNRAWAKTCSIAIAEGLKAFTLTLTFLAFFLAGFLEDLFAFAINEPLLF